MNQFKGFTLIEVLIALVILSISLTAIIKATSQNIKETAYVQDKTVAHWVALFILNECQIGLIKLPSGAEPLTSQIDMLNKSWDWHAEILASPNKHIRNMRVSVSREGGEATLAEIQGYAYVQS